MNSHQLTTEIKETLIQTQSTLGVSFNKIALPISNTLLEQLSKVLNEHPIIMGDKYITINFRDTNYSTADGGYHPVEIALSKDAHNRYTILYITDFSYCGHHTPDLERELDFDFDNSAAFTRYGGWKNISSPEIIELYPLWEDNFIAYLDMEAYDQIELLSD